MEVMDAGLRLWKWSEEGQEAAEVVSWKEREMGVGVVGGCLSSQGSAWLGGEQRADVGGHASRWASPNWNGPASKWAEHSHRPGPWALGPAS